jgi:hypothetical protein
VPVTTKGIPSQALIDKSEIAMGDCEARALQGNYCSHHLHLRTVAVYIKDSQYWTLQLLEGTFYFGFGVLLAALSFIGIRRARS